MSETPVLLPKPSLLPVVLKAMPTLLVLLIMAGGWWAVHRLNEGDGKEHEQVAETVDVATLHTLVLPQGKWDAAGIESQPVEARPIQHVHVVPGRVRYDEMKHVDIRAPMDGILSELLVTPGEQVDSGQLLAVLRSAEIGQSRAEILKRQQQFEIANQQLQRETTLAENLALLSSMLDQGKPLESIESYFHDLSLGSYRQEILSAYSKMRLSAELLTKIEPLANSGSVPGRVLRERESERQISENAFRSARDQATFAANQSRLKAQAELAEAERQLNLAWQSLETLLGYKVSDRTVSLSDEDALSRLELRAPISGSIESLGIARNERISRGDSLMVLANTDSLCVAASIREGDWSAVTLQPGTPLTVVVPALVDRTFEAVIRYVGREVVSDTNSIPLIATIPNQDGVLRPGMFVRVTIPMGQKREVLAISPESVLQHENQQFVFLDLGDGRFQRVDVSLGESSDRWIEIVQGLSPGQRVVTRGAFLLKSELLLKGESD